MGEPGSGLVARAVEKGRAVPKFNFKAVEVEDVRAISAGLLDEIEQLLQVPRANLFIEVTQSVFVRDGEVERGIPVVEVEWLPRNKDLQDKAADIIAKHLGATGYDQADVIFTLLDQERFYRIRP